MPIAVGTDTRNDHVLEELVFLPECTLTKEWIRGFCEGDLRAGATLAGQNGRRRELSACLMAKMVPVLGGISENPSEEIRAKIL